MLREGGCENYERLPHETTNYVGAKQPRHLHVEKNELRLQAIDCLHRCLSVGRFTHHLDPLERGEHRAESRASKWLVINHERSDLHASAVRGTTRIASKPPSSRGPHVNRALFP